MSIKIYEILCSIYKKIFSRIENLFLKDNKIKKNNELFDFKFFNNIKIRKIEYENFEKIETNKYLQKIIFPRQVIKDLIIELF